MLLFTAIILPATITPRPVENKANYLHESVQVIILILQLALGQRWLSINESVQRPWIPKNDKSQEANVKK